MKPKTKATCGNQFSRSHLTLIAASAGAFVLAAPSAQAAWSLIDTFETYNNSTTNTTTATGGVWEGEFDGTGNAHVLDTNDGANLDHSGSGQVLQTVGGAGNFSGGGTNWRGNHTDLTQFSAGTALDATSTYFFQMKAVGSGTFDIMTGLTASEANIGVSNAWQDFAVMPFVANTNSLALSYRVANAGLDNNIIFNMATDTWYNIWWVVNNDLETFQVYWSTGTDDGVLGATATSYTNGFTGTALNAMGFMAAGTSPSQLQVDNIYFTSGVNTTFVPEPSVAMLGALGGLALLRRRR